MMFGYISSTSRRVTRDGLNKTISIANILHHFLRVKNHHLYRDAVGHHSTFEDLFFLVYSSLERFSRRRGVPIFKSSQDKNINNDKCYLLTSTLEVISFSAAKLSLV